MKLWKVCSTDIDSQKDQIIDNFHPTVEFSNEQYQVCLPWESEESQKSMVKAWRSIVRLNNNLDNEVDLTQLSASCDEHEELIMIEKIPKDELKYTNLAYYIHPCRVIKESSVRAKIGPGFNSMPDFENPLSMIAYTLDFFWIQILSISYWNSAVGQ